MSTLSTAALRKALDMLVHIQRSMGFSQATFGRGGITWQQNDDVIAELRAALLEEAAQPAFYGFMDKEQCQVNLCFTPHHPGGPNNVLPTAYYTCPPVSTMPLSEHCKSQLAGAWFPKDGDGDVQYNKALALIEDVEMLITTRLKNAQKRQG